MASKQLELVIKAKDAASAALNQIGKSAGTAGAALGGAGAKGKLFGGSVGELVGGLAKAAVVIEVVTTSFELLRNLCGAYSSDVKTANESTAGFIETVARIPLLGKASNLLFNGVTNAARALQGKQTKWEDYGKIASDLRKINEEQTKWNKLHRERMSGYSNALQESESKRLLNDSGEVPRKIGELQADLDKRIKESNSKLRENMVGLGVDPVQAKKEFDKVKQLQASWSADVKSQQQSLAAKEIETQAAKHRELIKKEQEASEKIAAAYRDRQLKIQSILADTQASILTAQKRAFDAQQVQAGQQLKQQLADVLKDNSGGNSFAAGAQKTQLMAALLGQKVANTKAATTSEREKIDDALSNSQRFALQERLKLGELSVQQSIRKLEIEQEYKREVESLQGILRNGAATPAQVANAKNRLSMIDRLKQARLAGDVQQVALPTGSNSRFLTGLAESHMEKEQKKQTELATKTYEKLDETLRFFQQQAQNGTQLVVLQSK